MWIERKDIHCGTEKCKGICGLFPDRKITTNTIVDWCGGVCSRKVVQRILVRNYEKKGRGKASYYQACQREGEVNGGRMNQRRK